MVFNVCVKFHENLSSGFKVMEWKQIVNTQRAITPKVGKPVTVLVFCKSSYGVQHLCEVS